MDADTDGHRGWHHAMAVVTLVFAALALLVWATFGWAAALLFVGAMLFASTLRNLWFASSYPEGKF